MRAYAKDIVQEYATLTGATVFKKAHTPFLAKVAERLDEEEEAKIHCWSRACDAVMSYLFHAQENFISGWISDEPADIFLEMFVDADFCGDEKDCYSTSGGWVQFTGPSTQFPWDFKENSPSTVARSILKQKLLP